MSELVLKNKVLKFPVDLLGCKNTTRKNIFSYMRMSCRIFSFFNPPVLDILEADIKCCGLYLTNLVLTVQTAPCIRATRIYVDSITQFFTGKGVRKTKKCMHVCNVNILILIFIIVSFWYLRIYWNRKLHIIREITYALKEPFTPKWNFRLVLHIPHDWTTFCNHWRSWWPIITISTILWGKHLSLNWHCGTKWNFHLLSCCLLKLSIKMIC